MKATTMSRHERDPLARHKEAEEPNQVAVTLIACLVILVVFVVVAGLR